MIYLWRIPEYYPNKLIAVYDRQISPYQYLFYSGIKLNPENVSQVYCYYKSETINDLEGDSFVRCHLRHNKLRAYIFTPNDLFYFSGGTCIKINIDSRTLQELKTMLSLTDDDIEKDPKILSDQQLEEIGKIKGCIKPSRLPTFTLKVKRDEILKYDSIVNNGSSPLINQRIIDILLQLAPESIQLFDTEIICKDGILTNYKFLNITQTIKGIDHEHSVYTKILNTEAIGIFRRLVYKNGCMRDLKLARDEESLGHILVTEDIKQAFEKAKIKGVRFVLPEDLYGPMRRV